MTGQTLGSPPGTTPVKLVSFAAVVTDSLGGGFWFPSTTGWVQDAPASIAGAYSLPTVFYISAADLAVAGRTTMLRTRLTVQTNAVAPGVEVRARVHDALFAGASGALTINANTQFDAASIASAPASSRSTAQSSGVALPADGLYLVDLWQASTALSGARYVWRCDVDAYYV